MNGLGKNIQALTMLPLESQTLGFLLPAGMQVIHLQNLILELTSKDAFQGQFSRSSKV